MAIPPQIAKTWAADVLPTLSEFTRIPCLSPAFDPDWASTGALDRAARLLEAWCADPARGVPGLRTEVLSIQGRTPVLLVEAPGADGAGGAGGAGDGPCCLVYGHLDKQPPLGQWRQGLGPFEAVLQGDLLYGRGTADDGYAVFAAVTALRELAERGADRPRVVVLIEASEESGSPDLPAYLEHLAPRIGHPEMVICLDSGCLTYDRLWVTASLRGNVLATIKVAVLTEGVHSGLAGGPVPSSFRLLRQLLSRLEDERTGRILVPGLTAEIPDHHRAAAAAVAARFGPGATGEFPVVEGLRLSGADDTENLLLRSWAPALAVIGMDGIPSVRDSGNVLRPYTEARISLRLPPSVDATSAAGELAQVLLADPPQGAHVTVELATPADGWVAAAPEPWVSAALSAASVECFGEPAAFYGEGGTIPFLAMLGRRYPDIPLVALGVLGPHSNAHGPNEFLHLPMAQAVTTAVSELLAAVPGARSNRRR